jgi:hypothetical protein
VASFRGSLSPKVVAGKGPSKFRESRKRASEEMKAVAGRQGDGGEPRR